MIDSQDTHHESESSQSLILGTHFNADGKAVKRLEDYDAEDYITPPPTVINQNSSSIMNAPQKDKNAAQANKTPLMKFPLVVGFNCISDFELDLLKKNQTEKKIWEEFSSNLPDSREIEEEGGQGLLPRLDIVVSGDKKITPIILLALVRGIPIVRISFLLYCLFKNEIPNFSEHEVTYFPEMSRFNFSRLGLDLKGLKLSIDTFPGSTEHSILSSDVLGLVLKEIGGCKVNARKDSDFILSDRSNSCTVSTIFKKVDLRWIVDSILQRKFLDVNKYFF